MKNILVLLLLLIGTCSFAADNSILNKELNYQNHINEIGVNLLNTNKINKKIIFTYNKGNYKKNLNDPAVTKHQIIFYESYFKYVENDDELAAFLAREISRAVKSYSGEWGGFVSSTQIKAAPKKYELFADKRAVDYMVKSGYNPVGLITYINKSATNGFLDKFVHNSPTKRMSVIYEYIYYNYPYYLKNNEYVKNKNYQNFLLNTTSNRAILKEKIQSGSTKELKYE